MAFSYIIRTLSCVLKSPLIGRSPYARFGSKAGVDSFPTRDISADTDRRCHITGMVCVAH